MKEQDLTPIGSGLTNQAQNPYSRGGPRFNRGEGNFMAENVGEVPTAAAPPQEQSGSQEFRQDGARRSREEQAAEAPLKESVKRAANEGPGPILLGGEGEPFRRVTTPEFQQDLINKKSADDLYRELIGKRNDAYRRLEQELRELDPDSPEGLQKRKQLGVLRSESEHLVDSLIAPYMRQRVEMGPAEEVRVMGIEELVKEKDGAPEGKKPAIRKEIQAKIRKLMELMSDPEDTPVADDVLRAIAYDEATAEEFLSRLIVFPLEDQQHAIRGFYGQINFQKFQRLMAETLTPSQHQRLLHLIGANEGFHNMNYIIRRNFEQFAQHSESLLPEHFTVLCQIRGADTVIRLYEEFSQEILARETRITEKEFQGMSLAVDEAFKGLASKEGLIESVYGGKMNSWELTRALIYGRNIFRVLVRAAEHIALSELHAEGDSLIYTSSPQKQFTQILNTLKFIVFRFKMEEELGGLEYLKKTLEYTTKKRREDGRQGGKVRIKTLQGTDVDMREFQGTIAARGVMATWRNRGTTFTQLRFYEGERLTNIHQFLKDHKEQIADLKERSDNEKLSKAEREKLKIEVRAFFAPLLDNTSLALGLLVSPSGIDVPVEFKELVWEKIVDSNPLFMASLLGRLEVDFNMKDNGLVVDGKQKVQALEDILVETWGTTEQKAQLGNGRMRVKKQELQRKAEELEGLTVKDKDRRSPQEEERITALRKVIDGMNMEYGRLDALVKELFKNPAWLALKEKLRIANELRIEEEERRLQDAGRLTEAPKTLEDYLRDLKFTDQENIVLKAIKENGRIIIPDISRIKQSYAWALNDTPFASLDWVELGQFYDRETGDLANFNKEEQALVKNISNPFAQPIDEIIKNFKEAAIGNSQVLGRKTAQDNTQPYFRTWLSMIQEKGGFLSLKRQKIFSVVQSFFRRPTSRAQEIAGMNAPSLDEAGTIEVLDKAVPEILRKEVRDDKTGKKKWDSTYDKLMIEFGVDWFHRIVLANLRDWGPFGIIAFLIALFKATTKGAKR